MLHEDHLPAVFDLYNQSVISAANVKHGKWFNKVRVGIRGFYFCDVFPCCMSSDLMPLRNWRFEGMVSSDRIPPRAFANDVHLVRHFA